MVSYNIGVGYDKGPERPGVSVRRRSLPQVRTQDRSKVYCYSIRYRLLSGNLKYLKQRNLLSKTLATVAYIQKFLCEANP